MLERDKREEEKNKSQVSHDSHDHDPKKSPKLRKTHSRPMLDNGSRLLTTTRFSSSNHNQHPDQPSALPIRRSTTRAGSRTSQITPTYHKELNTGRQLNSNLQRCKSNIIESTLPEGQLSPESDQTAGVGSPPYPGNVGSYNSGYQTFRRDETLESSDLCTPLSENISSSHLARNTTSVQTSPMMGGGLRYQSEARDDCDVTNDFRPSATALLTPTVQRKRAREQNGAGLTPASDCCWDEVSRCHESADCKTPACCCDREQNIYENSDEVPPYPCFCRLRVTINVSGQIYETHLRTLERFPETLLGRADKRKPYFDHVRNQYFFDRSRTSFDAILQYYQSGGRLQRPRNVPVDVFADEILFYQLGPGAMQMYQEDEGYVFEDQEFTECGATSDIFDRKREKLPENQLQREIWLLFEKSDSSRAARFVAVISITIIFLSIICFCLETVPQLAEPYKPYLELDSRHACWSPVGGNFSTANYTLNDTDCIFKYNESLKFGFNISDYKNQTIDHFKWKRKPMEENPFWIIETICISWFCIELFCRFLSSPEKKKFCFDCLNVIDLIAIIPYFVTTASQASTESTDEAANQKGISLAFIRVVRLVRVFRIFKLSRHSTGLQILGQTLKSSFRELGLLLFFVLIGVVLFSSAVYFAENQGENPLEGKQPQTYFKSIPDAFWWAIVTMTTVGYGDMHPVTVQGKVVGSVCAMSGILCLALPVPVIVSNFMYFYQRDVANKKRTFST